jgi:glycerol-3-phosphate dehydrogenase
MHRHAFDIERHLDAVSGTYDVAIIGGGITGICLAREAAGRGLRVILFDRGDFGAETSAATTKYIHGGIRYLEQYDVAVVRESLRERRILALGAPHLVEQVRFIMPAWKWSKPPTALIGAGVLLYDALSYDRNRRSPDSLRIPHPKWMSKSELLDAVPWLDETELQGAFAYFDTLNIHPERLLLSYAKAAAAAGATLLNHVRVDGFVTSDSGDAMSDGRAHDIAVSGVEFTDVLTGERGSVAATVVVNASGPWIDRVLAALGRPTGVRVDRSKGVHILTRPLGGPGRVDDAVFARARSGRHVIVSPWMGKSFIGPTDTPLLPGPDGAEPPVAVDVDDVDLILDTVNSTMGNSAEQLTYDDVELTTVGIRPLIHRSAASATGGTNTGEGDADEADTYSASRAHEFYHHREQGIANLWSIGGGKWTTARATAEQMIDQLARFELAATPMTDSLTRHQGTAGAFAWAEDAEPFLVDASERLRSLGLSGRQARHLARLYGTEWVRLAEMIRAEPELGRSVSTNSDDLAVQVVFAVIAEGARTLSDIVDRRLVLGTLGHVDEETLESIARIAAPFLAWSSEECLARAQREYERRSALERRWQSGVSERH